MSNVNQSMREYDNLRLSNNKLEIGFRHNRKVSNQWV